MSPYEWLIIGAGPAGILAVSKLIDSGCDPQQIAWIDPNFKVGDFGSKWREVPSNTKVKLFTAFLESINCVPARADELHQLDPLSTCALSYMADSLQYITEQLTEQVSTYQYHVSELNRTDGDWQCLLSSGSTIHTQKCILAIGAEPQTLSINTQAEYLDIELALTPSLLRESISANDTIAVFGSSHSAILVLKNLYELELSNIYNFYLEPCKYALDMGDWILFDNTGLKGEAANWA